MNIPQLFAIYYANPKETGGKLRNRASTPRKT
jgi:hypothetical protein